MFCYEGASSIQLNSANAGWQLPHASGLWGSAGHMGELEPDPAPLWSSSSCKRIGHTHTHTPL